MILPYVATAVLVIATVYSAIVSFRQPEDGERSWIFPAATTRATRIFAGALTLALLTGVALWPGVSARDSTRRSSRVLIPEGYRGWIRVEFEVQDAPPLPVEGGQDVLRIPPDGALRTSSAEPYGWANYRYYYYSAQGVRTLPDSGDAGLIWGKINVEKLVGRGKRKYKQFFVGTEQQFKDQAEGEK